MKSRILIIEDEATAAMALQDALQQSDGDMEIINIIESIEDSVAWFKHNTMPDLVFMDIHLADGSAFEIFKEIEISCPIIFCTAYDAYAIRAFEVNSIGYILKPIQNEALQKALKRFYKVSSSDKASNTGSEVALDRDWEKLRAILQPKTYRQQFLIPQKDRLIPLSVNQVAYFVTELKLVKAVCLDGSQLIIEYTLEELEELLNPEYFFRMNRQYIIQHKAIKDISIWFNGKLALDLCIKTPDRILVSKARVSDFKSWFATSV